MFYRLNEGSFDALSHINTNSKTLREKKNTHTKNALKMIWRRLQNDTLGEKKKQNRPIDGTHLRRTAISERNE